MTETRRAYLDWLRGLAVLIMIEAHVLDSWTRFDDRDSTLFVWSMIAGGFGAPLFLFLAGVSVALSAGSKVRRGREAGAAAMAVFRRGLLIFGLAFLFRLQAVVVSWGSWSSMLKVDILNIMGPSIAAAAAIWGIARTPRTRLAAFAFAALAVAFLTPPVRAWAVLTAVPDPIEAYLRPVQPYSAFIFFPWMAFVFAGGAVGVLLDERRTPRAERTANAGFAAGGMLLAAGAYAASYLPSVFANSEFWTSSPAYFLLRAGTLIAAVGGAYAWERRPGGAGRWSPVAQIGRTSLFIYWIHIELIYGLMVRPLHKSLSLEQAWIGVVLFSALMVGVSVWKQRVFGPFDSRRSLRAGRGLMRAEGREPEVESR